MTTLEVGKKLVALCREGKAMQAVQTLYADNIVSVEAMPSPNGGGREHKGRETCLKRGQEWEAAHEIHSAGAEGPFPHDERFAVFFHYDVTDKNTKNRMKLDEVGLYTVKEGKIVREEFFYTM